MELTGTVPPPIAGTEAGGLGISISSFKNWVFKITERTYSSSSHDLTGPTDLSTCPPLFYTDYDLAIDIPQIRRALLFVHFIMICFTM